MNPPSIGTPVWQYLTPDQFDRVLMQLPRQDYEVSFLPGILQSGISFAEVSRIARKWGYTFRQNYIGGNEGKLTAT